MAALSVTLSVEKMPKVIAALRHELVGILREVGEAEASSYVKGRLNKVAAAFECGQGASDVSD